MTGNLILSIALSISLKQLWNLLNVIQVLAISREFTNWPALVDEIIKYITDSIYLTRVKDLIFSYTQSEFELAKTVTGIESEKVFYSLGLFILVFVAMLLSFLLYLIICRFSCCARLKSMIKRRLCYRVPIRFVIVGYLKFFN